MLTTDLVRATQKGEVLTPRKVSLRSKLQLERADAMLHLFREHIGCPRETLDRALADRMAELTDFKLQRGLAKLLFDRCELEQAFAGDASSLRTRVFEIAEEEGPPEPSGMAYRRRVLQRVAAEVGLTPFQVEDALFSDLKGSLIVRNVPNYGARELLERYNTALYQAILCRAFALRVIWRNGDLLKLQSLIRILRFFRLMFRVEQEDSGGIVLHVDGPLSLFRQSTKYGSQMAMFFPFLLLSSDWEASAQVMWNNQSCRLDIHSEDGLVSHARERGAWHREEEVAFFRWLEEKHPQWSAAGEPAIFPLEEGEHWIPDFSLRHADGMRVWVEWIGYWRKEQLERRLHRISQLEGTPALLLVSTKLQVDEETLRDLPAEVIPVRGVLPGKKILEAAERLRAEEGK